MCVLSFIICKIRPKNQVSLPVCAYLNLSWLTAQTQTTSHKLPYLVRSHAFIVNNNYTVLTTIIYLFLKLSTVTVRRNQPARNPREGMLQTLKKEKIHRTFK